jgi:hypothetical protein
MGDEDPPGAHAESAELRDQGHPAHGRGWYRYRYWYRYWYPAGRLRGLSSAAVSY